MIVTIIILPVQGGGCVSRAPNLARGGGFRPNDLRAQFLEMLKAQGGYLVLAAVLAWTAGCRSTRPDSAIFEPWGWESVEYAQAQVDSYKHVLVVRIEKHSWNDRGPYGLTPHHFQATVVRSYKGDWKSSDPIAWVHYVDSSPPVARSSDLPSQLMFVFTNERAGTNMVLETGQFGKFSPACAPALEYLFPRPAK